MSTETASSDGRRVLIDTSVWIEAFGAAGDARCQEKVTELVTDDRAATCEVVIAELLRGASSEGQATRMDRVLRGVTVLACEGMGTIAAAMGRELGAPRDDFADLLIAAIAFQHGAILLTRDRGLGRLAAEFEIPHMEL